MSSSNIYQLKVTLAYSKPVIWRRILVASNTLLPDLHKVLQITMGWENAHLNQFIHQDKYYTASNPLGFFTEDESEEDGDYDQTHLNDLLINEKDAMIYEYDFGDGWTHKILLEKILEPDSTQKYPQCIKGKNACPPEDCGGIGGYLHLLEILGDAKHPQYDDMTEWLGLEEGEKFDSSYFDLTQVNQALQSDNYGVFG